MVVDARGSLLGSLGDQALLVEQQSRQTQRSDYELEFHRMPPFVKQVTAFHGIDGSGGAACAKNYYHRKTENFFYNWAAQDLEKDLQLVSQSNCDFAFSLNQILQDHCSYDSRPLNCLK